MKISKTNLLFLTVVLLLLGPVCKGQVNLNKTIKLGSSFDDHPLHVFMGYDNDIVISGWIDSVGFQKPFMVLLDSAGNLKEKKSLDNYQYSHLISNGFKTTNGYLFAGVKGKVSPSFEQSLYVIHTTDQLAVQDSFLVSFSDSLDIVGSNIKKFESTLIWHGYAYVYNTYRHYPFVIKTDLNGTILNQHIGDYQNYEGFLNYALTENFDKNGYLLFDYKKVPPGIHYAVNIDHNLNFKSTGHIKLADSIVINNIQSMMFQIFEAKQFKDKLVYLGRGYSSENFYIAITDSQSVTVHHKAFDDVYDDDFYLFADKPLAVNDNYVFVSFEDSIMSHNPRYTTFTNKITVAKLDTALNTVWEKRLGWDAYYFQQDIVATDDGGCLVMGSVYDKDTMSLQHDIVLFKLDANGNVTGTHRIENAAGQSLKTYPNPGEDYFNMDIPFAEGEIQVFDQNGKLLFSRTAKPGRNRVDMSRYASGIYFVRLRDDNDQLMGTGKWIKR